MKMPVKIFSGTAHPELARKVAARVGERLGKIDFRIFPNREQRPQIKEDVRDAQVLVIQPLCEPPDENLIQLCLITDALKRAKAKEVIAITPWLAYSPQDKIFRRGEPFSSAVCARILEASGIDQIIVCDPHSNRVLENFKIPVTTISAIDLFAQKLKKKADEGFAAVSLDRGDRERSQKLAQILNCPVIKFEKEREKATGEVTFTKLRGDPSQRTVVCFDDYVSTGGTLVNGAKIIKEKGAKKIVFCVTHALLCGNCAQKIEESPIDELLVTDSVPIPQEKIVAKIKIVSIAPLIVQEIGVISGTLQANQ